MKQIQILAIVGSLRKESFNRQLAMAAKSFLGDSVQFELLEYADVPLFNQDIEFPAPEAVSRVREKVKSADGVWFFTPEYNHYFPGVLKNLLDWLSRPISDAEGQVLANKPAALCGISPGATGTVVAQDHLVALISLLNMDVMNVPRLVIPNAMEQINENGKLDLVASARYLERQATAFFKLIEQRIR